jgi:antitoxin component of MazEF toxin-antitoxin module
METRVQRWGNSLALRIPKAIAAEAGLAKAGLVDVSLADGRIVVTPVDETGETLADQVKSLDWRVRPAQRAGTLPGATLGEVLRRLRLLWG